MFPWQHSSLTAKNRVRVCNWTEHVTEQFADEWLSFKRLEVVDVFSCSDEDDGTPGGCHSDGNRAFSHRRDNTDR